MIVVRWSHGTNYPTGYFQAAINIKLVGAMTARMVRQLQRVKHLDLNRTNVVGFSLGAPLVGHIGQELKGELRQIVGACVLTEW